MQRGLMIGAGYFAGEQLKSWTPMEGVEIAAICDFDESKAKQRAAEFGISRTYTRLEEMLDKEDADFLDIVTRPGSHPALVAAGAEAGLHILCQKPFGETMAACREMVETCKSKGVRLMVNENGRWQLIYRKLKELLERAVVGRPVNYTWISANNATYPDFKCANQPYMAEMPRLIIYESVIHKIDTARFLFGEPRTVFARTHSLGAVAGENEALVIMDFEYPVVVLSQSWAGGGVQGIEVAAEGRKGGGALLLIRGSEGSLVARGGKEWELYRERGKIAETFDCSSREASTVYTYMTQAHFVDCLETGAAFETSGEDYLKTMACVFAAYESAETGQAVDPAGLVGEKSEVGSRKSEGGT